MPKPYHYIALQYAAIQQTILRQDRLWSMAGISLMLSELNEIRLPEIARALNGQTLVAGGGKFTARFENREDAEKARREIVKEISTTFPMLEFQVSPEPVAAASLSEARESKGLIRSLNEAKMGFRGYAVSCNPHMALCTECGEYPAIEGFGKKNLCAICHNAKQRAWIDFAALRRQDPAALTTIERIYRRYAERVELNADTQIALDFDTLFSSANRSSEDFRQRMAVWFADINNMNDKVPVWLGQPEEQIFPTFERVKNVFIEIIADALRHTFGSAHGSHLPFRIIVAGGDDLCLVMPETKALAFGTHLSAALAEKLAAVGGEPSHPLNLQWIEAHRRDGLSTGAAVARPIAPYGFGSAFVVAPIHTPFARLHQVGEELMSTAKQGTNRMGNSVNWRIMAETEALAEQLLDFERPLFIEDAPDTVDGKPWQRLSFNQYRQLVERHAGISSSHKFQIVDHMVTCRGDTQALERKLNLLNANRAEKSFSGLLSDPALRIDGQLAATRLATLFELMSVASERKEGAA